jgi:hypothetical protein
MSCLPLPVSIDTRCADPQQLTRQGEGNVVVANEEKQELTSNWDIDGDLHVTQGQSSWSTDAVLFREDGQSPTSNWDLCNFGYV